MIRDYRSDTTPRIRRRSHGLVLLSAAFLGGVAYAVHRIDLQGAEVRDEAPAETADRVQIRALPIPAKASQTAIRPLRDRDPAEARSASTPPDLAADESARRTEVLAETREVGPTDAPPLAPSGGESGAARDAGREDPIALDDESRPPDPPRQQVALLDAPTSASPTTPLEHLTTADQPPSPWTEHLIERGDTLAGIFRELGYSPTLLYRITHSSAEAKGLADIRPGQRLRLRRGADNELLELIHIRDKVSSLQILRSGEGFTAEERHKDVETRVASLGGTIADSLFVDGQAAGMSDAKIMELAKIFSWDIDFALEIRAGDRFSVIYEERFVDGERLTDGPILAAEFVNRGTVYRAVRFADKDGIAAYYDPNGKLKQRAFTRTPVDFGRISSRFTNRRWHPVLKKWRSHKGVDYAAPTGTPVKATGAGRISFIGRKGGYGKAIFIKHGDEYTTVYGHLSRFNKGLKTGSKVKQGQVIGRVGQTGLASGPHLHYEFRVNGRHRNPLTVKLPSAIALNKAQMPAFKRDTKPLLAQLETAARKTMLASAFANEG